MHINPHDFVVVLICRGRAGARPTGDRAVDLTKKHTEIARDCLIDNIDSYNFHLKIGFEEMERCIFFVKRLKKYPNMV